MIRYIDLLVILSICCILYACKKEKEKDINVRKQSYRENELKIHDIYPKEGTHGDTLVLYGNFFTENVKETKVYFTNINLPYTLVTPISVTENEIAVIVPELEAKRHTERFKLEVYITVGDTTYTGVADSIYTYDDGYYDILSINAFWPKEVRRGQTITLTSPYYNTPPNDIRIKFAGTSEWQSPVGYDPYDTWYYVAGPVYRVPENATDGPIQVWSAKRLKPTESKEALSLLPPMSPLQQGVWVRRANFAARSGNDSRNGNGQPRTGAAVFVIKDKVYVVGGHTMAPLDQYGFDSVWEYDPKYNSWIQKRNFPGGARVGLVGFSIGNKGYAGLGEDRNQQPRNDFWEYDPETDTWERKADFTGTPRLEMVGVAAGNTGYVGSGTINYQDALNDFYAYNPVTNRWSAIAPIPEKRAKAYAFIIDGNIYVGGGESGDQKLSDMYMYQAGSNTWVTKNGIPGYNNTSSNASFTLNGKAYVGLGTSKTHKYTEVNWLFEYSPYSDQWRALPALNIDGRYEATGVSVGNAAYILSGMFIGGFRACEDVWGYIP